MAHLLANCYRETPPNTIGGSKIFAGMRPTPPVFFARNEKYFNKRFNFTTFAVS